MPSGDYRLVEPFVGSAAVFINSPYQRALLADVNPDVISLYRTLKVQCGEFMETCRRMFTSENNTEERFYEIRTEFNASKDPVRRTSLFLYLNRHCFNGLCRYNKGGEFNTPFGRYSTVYFPEKEMTEFAKRLATVELEIADFRTTLASAGRGDVVYCDPPYLPIGQTGFTAYSGATFSMEDHAALTSSIKEAAARGAIVLVSNHDTPSARNLYKDASRIDGLFVSRTISCDGLNRNKVKEIIAIFDMGQSSENAFVLQA